MLSRGLLPSLKCYERHLFRIELGGSRLEFTRFLALKRSESVSFDDLPEIVSSQKQLKSSKVPKVPKVPKVSKSEEADLQDGSTVEDRGAITEKKPQASLFKTIRALQDRYKDYVVFVQVGGFYELYFETAEKYAPLCDLKVTQRYFKSTGPIWFAGFPVASLNKYLKILVNDHGLSVAVADQYVNALEDGKISRRVARIVTPGTLIDEALRNFQQNNYLLAISFPEDPCQRVANPDMKVGLAWSDVALGDFYVQETTLKDVMTDISRIRPSEILLDETLASDHLESGQWYPDLAELQRFYIKYQNLPSNRKPIKSFYDMFNDDSRTLDICFNELSQKELSASISILYYISENLPDSEPNLALPERQLLNSLMQIDSRTSDALELHTTFRDNKKVGSLLSSIKNTVTAAGTRLLSTWISAPSTSITEIKRRQQLVDTFRKNSELRTTIIHQLKLSADMSRIVQRLSLGKIDVVELCSLAKTLFIVNDIKETLIEGSKKSQRTKQLLKPLIENLQSPISIAKQITRTIDEDALMRNMKKRELEREKLEEGEENGHSNDDHALNVEEWVVRKDANTVLRRCHDEYEVLLDKKEVFLQEAISLFKNSLGCRSVELQLHKIYGYVICVLGSQKVLSNLKEAPLGYHLLHSTKQSRLYYHKEWKYIGTDTQSHVDRIRAEEVRILATLRRKVLAKTLDIRTVAHCLDYLDVISSFAVLALERSLVMPKITDTEELNIIGGRHIVVEEGLKESSQSFTTNDCYLNSEKVWVISGPNMGGKSTFLRQNAIIVIMAQIGSFIPAEKATIGVVDKVFSRVGSADDLYRELSTFMVEMVETGFILKNATSRSLAILDEVGRGTSGKEGLAIAYATLLYLLTQNQCRTLFATHFGSELYDLLEKLDDEVQDRIGYRHTSIESVEGDNDSFLFDHKLREGISKKSYAIEVAQLSGLPKEAIEFAKESLQRIESSNS